MSISDDEALRKDRGPEWCAIYDTLRDYRLSNMTFEGSDDPFCLVDLVSTIGGDISTGEAQLLELADEISLAIEAAAKVRAIREGDGLEVPDIKLALANMLEIRDDAMGFISNDDERCRTAIEMHDAVQRIHAKLLDQPYINATQEGK